MTERIKIENCPLCASIHTYSIEVTTGFVFKLMTLSSSKERPKSRRFTRLFVCPVKNQKFQAAFILYEASDSPIKSVEIKGVEDETEEE